MTKPTNPALGEGDDLPEQLRVRREKRQRLLDQGIDPYPVAVQRTTTLAAVREAFPDLPPDTDTGEIVGIAGRVIFLRNSGKLCFATLREGGAGDTGTELQVMVSLASVGAESLAAFKANVATTATCNRLIPIMAPPSTVLIDSSLEAHDSVLGGTLVQPAALVTMSGIEDF